jgi:hypothetical protein
MTKKKGSADASTTQGSASKDSRAESLAKLQAQKILAIQAGNTKAAAQIQKVIDLLTRKK